MKLVIKDLHVSVDNNEIIKGLSLVIKKGEVHALMGPNGSGKSTLAHALMGHPKYTITKGQIILDGKDITHAPPHDRAKLGLFLSFQYPAEIPGVTISNFLRMSLSAIKGEKVNVVEFHQMLKKKMADLKIDPSFSKRYLNEGFSGGEKKRAEILQMSILQPTYAILDETDSGLDVDALRIVAEGINSFKSKEKAFLLITHYNRILHYIIPDFIHVIYKGKIIKSGEKDLALEIEQKGFAFLTGDKDAE